MYECIICYKKLSKKDLESNKIPCGHKICSICLYEYLKGQIENAKVTKINCFVFKCKEILSENYITRVIESNTKLMEKYNYFKKRAEIIASPTKKFCPEKDCQSFIERKNGDNKYVSCENGHKYCYVCLKPWHGSDKCEEQLDKDFQIWKQNKVIKRCPKCKFYTEKNEGCNHMTCAECKYQWCWLCEGKYNSGHYTTGKCAGQQFTKATKPNDEISKKYINDQNERRRRDRWRRRNNSDDNEPILEEFINLRQREKDLCSRILSVLAIFFGLFGIATIFFYYIFFTLDYPRSPHVSKRTKGFINVIAVMCAFLNSIFSVCFFFPLTLAYFILTLPCPSMNIILTIMRDKD